MIEPKELKIKVEKLLKKNKKYNVIPYNITQLASYLGISRFSYYKVFNTQKSPRIQFNYVYNKLVEFVEKHENMANFGLKKGFEENLKEIVNALESFENLYNISYEEESGFVTKKINGIFVEDYKNEDGYSYFTLECRENVYYLYSQNYKLPVLYMEDKNITSYFITEYSEELADKLYNVYFCYCELICNYNKNYDFTFTENCVEEYKNYFNKKLEK